jgi:hypothetical protein
VLVHGEPGDVVIAAPERQANTAPPPMAFGVKVGPEMVALVAVEFPNESIAAEPDAVDAPMHPTACIVHAEEAPNVAEMVVLVPPAPVPINISMFRVLTPMSSSPTTKVHVNPFVSVTPVG